MKAGSIESAETGALSAESVACRLGEKAPAAIYPIGLRAALMQDVHLLQNRMQVIALADIARPVTEQRLTAAAHYLAGRHPLMRATRDPARPRQLAVDPVPDAAKLTVLHETSSRETDGRALLRRVQGWSFAAPGRYLWGLAALSGEKAGATRIVLFGDHTIADGLSLALVFGELIGFLAGRNALSPTVSLPLPADAEAIDRKGRGLAGALRFAALAARYAWLRLSATRTRPPCAPARDVARFYLAELTVRQGETISRTAARSGVRYTSVLVTALSLALREVCGAAGAATRITMMIATDARPVHALPPAATLAMLAAGGNANVTIRPGDGMSDVAPAADAFVTRALNRDELEVRDCPPWLLRNSVTTLSRRTEQGLSAAVSNLGRLDALADHAPLLGSCLIAFNNKDVTMRLFAYSVGERTFLGFASALPGAIARRVIHRFLGHLELDATQIELVEL